MADGTTNNDANEADNRPLNAPRGLVCAACGHRRLSVVYTRPRADGQIMRRRECKNCGKRVTTWERMIGQVQTCNDDVGRS
jgi:DNA-directed RNA polymerase subunit M/transcription elongation factor TFIIS